MKPRLALIAWLAVVWVTLQGELSAGDVLGGLAVALVVTWLLPLPVLDPGIRLRPVALVDFLLWFGRDMVVSTVRVVVWVVRPGVPPTQIVRVRLRTSSESMTVMIMVALSSVPGSLVVEAYPEERELVLHVLGRPGDVTEAVRADVAALEARIVAAFGTLGDREELP
ncbi:Na+/H+ antiporter subunit E [Nonomuraea jabiensis]|uniref:Multicomponent Na+:H+ antiporter subunit E n=1 Tax=Nonomuraea jabiensis TaxID=882448 RepID=A0A7W9GB70_9ACTN|nr:Na+/H+ antiporter subunit E [Nonomuraea jabiensis]MBB5780575.1 multicomponent Na+:H+ antiporter subunit E [Nonomuraea jabiensis]